MWTILLAVAAMVAAGTCWYGAYTDNPRLAHWAKPAVPALLILVALSRNAAGQPGGSWLLIGLVLALVADAALLSASSRAFLAGQMAYALAQLAFVVAFVAYLRIMGLALLTATLGLAIAALFAGTAGRRIHAGALASDGPTTAMAVAAYAALMVVMATMAGATGHWLIILGGVLFVVSHTVLALDRFVGERAQAPLVVMSTYHLALGGFVAGLLS